MWYPEPAFRGTYGLLSNCIVTLALCVWTAVHLDIPEPGHANSQWNSQWLWRLKWLTVGILTPELVTYVAWVQWRRAVKLDEDANAYNFIIDQPPNLVRRTWLRLCEHLGKLDSKSTNDASRPEADITSLKSSRKNTWTPIHSAYACMGGFVFETSSDAIFLPGSRTHAVLTPKGVSFLMQHAPHVLPDISHQYIADKSKANGLTKLLVCSQAAWFCLQCVTRLAQHLPVSLLELNTFAHATCTLITYILWWNKPLDISEPTLIQGEDARMLCAYMWMASPNPNRPSNSKGGHSQAPEFGLISERPRSSNRPNSLEIVRSHDRSRSPNTYRSLNSHRSSTIPLERLRSSTTDDGSYYPTAYPVQLCPGDELGDTNFIVGPLIKGLFAHIPLNQDFDQSPPILYLEEYDVDRWKLASRAISKHGLPRPGGLRSGPPAIRPRLRLMNVTPLHPNRRSPHGPGVDGDLVVTRIQMPLAILQTWRLEDIHRLWGIAVVSALYGTLHALAWNAKFPSEGEKIWWRSAAIFVMVFGIVPPLAASLGFSTTWLGWIPWGWVRGIAEVVLISVLNCGIPVYGVARIFLVVESFKDVFSLPSDAFLIPEWSRYLPHF